MVGLGISEPSTACMVSSIGDLNPKSLSDSPLLIPGRESMPHTLKGTFESMIFNVLNLLRSDMDS